MSPFVHLSLSWLLAQPLAGARDRRLVTLAGVVADIDGLGAVFGVEMYHRFHHTFAHNVFAGAFIVAAIGVAAVSRLKTAALAALAYALHLLCDAMGSGYGWEVKPLWPLSDGVLKVPDFALWEFMSWPHAAVSVACFVAICFVAVRRGRSPVEVVSLKWDAAVVGQIRQPCSAKLVLALVASAFFLTMCTIPFTDLPPIPPPP